MDSTRNAGGTAESTNSRIRFGIGQNQAQCNKKYRKLDIHSGKILAGKEARSNADAIACPTISSEQFAALPMKVKDFIRRAAGVGKRMIRNHYGTSALGNPILRVLE